MPIKKYINTTEVAELTGQSYAEIVRLARTGVLPSHKTRRGHYRLNVEAVEKYFDVQINEPILTDNKLQSAIEELKANQHVIDERIVSQQPQFFNGTLLIINEDHYQEIIERICAAKSSIKIMTANFKRFNLKPTDNQGEKYKDGTPFVKYLMAKAVQGVSVQIICSMPSSTFTEEWKEYYRQMMNPTLFEYKFCERNHAKVIIIDDSLAYVGSANVTPAGLGQGIFTPGNFEAGILTNNSVVVSSINALFSKIWYGEPCADCHRKDKCEQAF